MPATSANFSWIQTSSSRTALSLARAIPGIPERWIANPYTSFSDISSGGWILAHDFPPADVLTPDGISATLLPLRFKGRHEPDPQGSPGVFVEEAVGVDDFSIGSSDPGLSPDGIDHVQDRIWIMAPKGADKTVVLNAPLGNGTELDLSSTGVRFDGQSHANCASHSSSFTIRAQDEFLDGDSDLMLDIGDGTFSTPAANTPVRIKRMKARTVNVTVYKVGDLLNQGGAVIDADRVPDELVLQAYLNRVYKPQVNLNFTVTIMPEQAETSVDSNANGILDWDTDIHTADQSSIATAALAQAGAATGPANITVYLVGTNKRIGRGVKGVTTPPQRTCWVKCRGLQSYREEEETADVIRTIAHEIGHVMLGGGHPGIKDGSSQGIAPLPGTRHSERLMRDGNNNPDSDACLLVKAEWDEIEKWLQNEEIEQRMNQ